MRCLLGIKSTQHRHNTHTETAHTDMGKRPDAGFRAIGARLRIEAIGLRSSCVMLRSSSLLLSSPSTQAMVLLVPFFFLPTTPPTHATNPHASRHCFLWMQ